METRSLSQTERDWDRLKLLEPFSVPNERRLGQVEAWNPIPCPNWGEIGTGCGVETRSLSQKERDWDRLKLVEPFSVPNEERLGQVAAWRPVRCPKWKDFETS